MSSTRLAPSTVPTPVFVSSVDQRLSKKKKLNETAFGADMDEKLRSIEKLAGKKCSQRGARTHDIQITLRTLRDSIKSLTLYRLS